MTKTIKSVRMYPHERKQKILEAAIQLSIEKGFKTLTRKDVAKASDSAQGLISHYFRNINNLRHEVLKEAVRLEIMPILIENLSVKELPISPELKQKVINYLNN